LSDAGDVYLSVGSDFRVRYEWFDDANWGAGSQDGDGYVWWRALPYADLHLGPNVRVFTQLQAAYASELEEPPSPVDETGVELLQGFVDVRLPVADELTLTLRPGRQLLVYGSQRLIGMRYGPNVLQTFDALKASVSTGPWIVDAFYARPVETDPDSFDDESNDSISVWSVYATRKLPSIGPRSGIDLYYIGYANESARFNQGPGDELRHTLGSRFFGTREGWDWNFEAFLQFGDYDAPAAEGDIFAWSLASDTGYTFRDAPLSPRVSVRANIISGDDDPTDPDLQTFNPLFPRGKYFGEVGLLGPYNLINVHPAVSFKLSESVTLDLATAFYWRYSTDDGIYANSGRLLRADSGSDARYIGTQAEASLIWSPDRYLEVLVSYGIFSAGPFIEETGPDEVVHFVGIEARYWF
jgi:hypothetical protein